MLKRDVIPVMVGTGKKRLTHIDVAKGIGILLTLLGHCLVYSGYAASRPFAVIYSYHMPLFFFLSGYMYKRKAPTVYLSDKIKSLLFPTVLYQSINLLMFSVLFVIHQQDEYSSISFGGFWFLLTLLYISVMFYIVDLLTSGIKKSLIKHVIVLLSALVMLMCGLIYATHISDQPNQPIATAFVGYFFYVLGLYTRILEQRPSRSASRCFCGIIGMILLVVLTVTIRANSRTVDMNTSRYASQLVFFIHALLGIFGTYLLSAAINTNELLEFFGRNSLIVLLIHIPISKIVPVLVGIFGFPAWVKLTASIVLSITLSWAAIKLFDSSFPFMAGKVKWDELYEQREIK